MTSDAAIVCVAVCAVGRQERLVLLHAFLLLTEVIRMVGRVQWRRVSGLLAVGALLRRAFLKELAISCVAMVSHHIVGVHVVAFGLAVILLAVLADGPWVVLLGEACTPLGANPVLLSAVGKGLHVQLLRKAALAVFQRHVAVSLLEGHCWSIHGG